MKIMIDSEPLLPEQLTGIGYNQADTVKAYAKLFTDDQLIFSGFALRGKAVKKARIQKYADACEKGKGRVKLFPLLSSGMYRLAWGLCMLPIPYRLFFCWSFYVFHNIYFIKVIDRKRRMKYVE